MPFSVSSAPSVNWGPVCCVKVCRRKLAGTEDPSKHLQNSTEDRVIRRLQADDSVEAFGRNAPDNFGFGARSDGVKERRTQEKKKRNKNAADEDLQICHLQMPRVLDGRSVLER